MVSQPHGARRACKGVIEHPCESDAAVPDDLKIALFRTLTKGMHVVAKERIDLLRGMIERAKDLREEEVRFKQTLDPDVSDVSSRRGSYFFAGSWRR